MSDFERIFIRLISQCCLNLTSLFYKLSIIGSLKQKYFVKANLLNSGTSDSTHM